MCRIWRHLLEITSAGNTTIIITTHYIEEARQAHMVRCKHSYRTRVCSCDADFVLF